MLRETLEMNIKRLIDFLIYSRNFIIRKNPIKAMINSITDSLKDFLTMKKKLKMAQYRLNYHAVILTKPDKGKNYGNTRCDITIAISYPVQIKFGI